MPLFRIGDKLHYFAHVPKCAGSSVEMYLMSRFGKLAFVDTRYLERAAPLRWSRSSPQHIALEDFQRLIPQEWIASSFAVVRHPLSRLVSAFRFQVEVERSIASNWTIDQWFDDWLEKSATDPFLFDGHLRPQADLIAKDTTIFHLENGLDAIVPHLDALAGSQDGPRTVAAHNIRKPAHSPGVLQDKPSPNTLERIAAYYAEDYRRFGYDPNPTARPLKAPAPPKKNLLKRITNKLVAR